MSILIENSKTPLLFGENMTGLVIYPFIFLKGLKKDNLNVYRHEMIHIKQFQETLFIGYIIILLINYIYNFIKYRNLQDSYDNLLFEKEAYKYMDDSDYIENRKMFAWINIK